MPKTLHSLIHPSPVPNSPDGILLISVFKFFINFISHFCFNKAWLNTIYINIFLAYSIAKLFEKATIPAFDAE